MNRIRKVRIENFQSHVNTVLDFSDGLNIIVGPSDQGKSAVVRAIKWVLYNEPRGTDFIRAGETYARVTLELSNEHTIIRERSKSRNRYSILYPDKSSKVFEGFGNEVPQEVVNAHGIKKIVWDKDSIANVNIAEQLESAFLLTESGNMKAKAIGRLVGIHVLDSAIRDCSVDQRRNSQESERLENEIKNMDDKLKEFQDLPSIELKINRFIEILDQIKLLSGKEKMLSRCEVELKSFLEEEKQLTHNLGFLLEIEKTEAYIVNCKITDKKYEDMNNLHEMLQTTQNSIHHYRDILYKAGDPQKIEEVLDQVTGRIEKHERLQTLLSIKNRLLFEIRKYENTFDEAKQIMLQGDLLRLLESKLAVFYRVSELAKKYSDITDTLQEELEVIHQLKQEGEELLMKYENVLKKAEVCPLCGTNITEIKIEELVNHYREAHDL